MVQSEIRPMLACLCSLLVFHSATFPLLAAPGFGQGAEAGISIQVKEGEGALNLIRQLKAKEPVVVIMDAAGKPIQGAAVTFILPELGASGVFPGGTQLTVTTDESGVAIGRGLKPNNVVGLFKIRVVASYQGVSARTEITQTNAAPEKGGGGGGPSKTLWIVALVGGGAAAAAGVAFTRGGGKSSPGAVITPGSSVFNPPH